MTARDWTALIVVLVVALFGVHQYDGSAAKQAASDAATIVYQTQLKSCQDANPTLAQQRLYFATVAKGRATSAQNEDAGNPIQLGVDQTIARVAHSTAQTYRNRFGALPDGALNCRKTTARP